MSNMVTRAEDALHLFDTTGRQHLPSKNGYKVRCGLPGHPDRTASLFIGTSTETGSEKLIVKCFGGCTQEDVLNYINGRTVSGIRVLPNSHLRNLAGQKEEEEELEFKQTDVYPYLNGDGTLKYEKLRYEAFDSKGKKVKKFFFRRPSTEEEKADFDIDYVWSIDKDAKILYNLNYIETAKRKYGECQAFVVEGEKDADLVIKFGGIGTCNPDGAHKTDKWQESYNIALESTDSIVIPDHDIVGYQHALNIVKNLLGRAKRVRVLILPVTVYHSDLSDWAEGKSEEDFFNLVETAVDVTSLEQAQKLLDVSVFENSVVEESAIAETVLDSSENTEEGDDFQAFLNALEAEKKEVDTLTLGLCNICYGTEYEYRLGLGLVYVEVNNKSMLRPCPKCNKAQKFSLEQDDYIEEEIDI